MCFVVITVDGLYMRTSKDRHTPAPVLQCGWKNNESDVKFHWSSNGRRSNDDNAHYVITESAHPPKSVLNFTRIGIEECCLFFYMFLLFNSLCLQYFV